MEPLEIT